MLHSRNRKLKRISRFVGFFVIVGAGCYYRIKENFTKTGNYLNSDEFIEKNPLVPSFVKELHSEGKNINIKKKLLKSHRLPFMDEHEFRYMGKTLLHNEGLDRKNEYKPIALPKDYREYQKLSQYYIKRGGAREASRKLVVYRYWLRKFIFH
ncbi:unnamed protein product [Moneuplotes crassus]|uniref:Uncharacterized protein n=1 Tax=Euplotes crassus TaxID=5936 RepID=A0AAD1Y3I1_EUPCR|nr:unnamed protein product [Moneuplotes crassus]